MQTKFRAENYLEQLRGFFAELSLLLENNRGISQRKLNNALQSFLRSYPKDKQYLFSRDELIAVYRLLVERKQLKANSSLVELIRLKPTRTISGVTPVTVLTKPFPCPGKCIFCPNDIRMPKSYIASEPGAQRAGRNAFDPYLQTYNRLLALYSIGHDVSKVELIVLGGTWSFYPESYQIWFIKRCFDALNDFPVNEGRDNLQGIDFQDPFQDNKKKIDYNREISLRNKSNPNETASWQELLEAQRINETALCRNVGLVLETRPDHISTAEAIRLRRLGATKVQIGIQSLNDDILKVNGRGMQVKDIRKAFEILRLAGFKLHAHMMPNLYLATPESDLQDYTDLWSSYYSPDELKIYPTSIIKGTELYELHRLGKYRPYSLEELKQLLKSFFKLTPRFCRLTRVIRDIPSQEIEAGNRTTNLRQIVERELIQEGSPCMCIRCREIKNAQVTSEDLALEVLSYETSCGRELFISYRTKKDDRICGFLRLSLSDKFMQEKFAPQELHQAAVIREVHVYGKVTRLGERDQEHTQHLGLGRMLIAKAEELAKKEKFAKISVISAIGTRVYYRKLGYSLEELYMHKTLP